MSDLNEPYVDYVGPPVQRPRRDLQEVIKDYPVIPIGVFCGVGYMFYNIYNLRKGNLGVLSHIKQHTSALLKGTVVGWCTVGIIYQMQHEKMMGRHPGEDY